MISPAMSTISCNSVEIIKKYSNFVGSPIFLNGKKINTLEVRDMRGETIYYTN